MIFIKKLYKSFISESGEKSDILNGIDLNIKRGETILLEGPNGSGKTTLLSIIAGLIPPSSGEVKVCGEWISKLPDLYSSSIRRDKIGFIFQEFNLIEDLTVAENIIMPLIPGNITEGKISELKDNAIEEFNLLKLINKKTKNLSGGEKQRIAIARATINNPELILADEPTSQIDKNRKEFILSYFRNFKKKGKTIIIASHDQFLKGHLDIDKIIKLDSGNLIIE